MMYSTGSHHDHGISNTTTLHSGYAAATIRSALVFRRYSGVEEAEQENAATYGLYEA